MEIASRSVAKQAYYREGGMPRALAERYLRQFAGARSLLDLGCGRGEFGHAARDAGIEVHGVDCDAGAVAAAARWAPATCADLEAGPLPFADASFDGVLAKDIFEHVQQPGPLAAEAFRVLRPGGVIVASVVMARPRRVWADYTHVRGFSERSARLLLEDVGFRVEAVWRMGGVPLSARLGLIDAVPLLLRLPPLDALWGSSWELRGRR